MLLIAIFTYLSSAAAIIAGVRFFTRCDWRRQEDEHLVAALMVSALFFVIVHTLAVIAAPTILAGDNPITSLWIGFDFFVSVVHLTIIVSFSRRRTGRTAEETPHVRFSAKRPQYK